MQTGLSKNAVLTTTAAAAATLSVLTVLLRRKRNAAMDAHKMVSEGDVPKDPREWSRSPQTVNNLVEGFGGLLPKSGGNPDCIIPETFPDLVADFLSSSVEPPLVSSGAPDDASSIASTPSDPRIVSTIQRQHLVNLVTLYANQFSHFDLEKEMSARIFNRVAEGVFKDMVALADPNLSKRAQILATAARWADDMTDMTDVIPGRAVETEQIKKMKAEAKVRRVKQAMSKIRTSGETGQMINFGLDRISSNWIVSTVWGAAAIQNILDGVGKLSACLGNGFRDVVGIRS